MDDIKTDKSEIEFSIEWHRQNRGLYGPNDGLYIYIYLYLFICGNLKKRRNIAEQFFVWNDSYWPPEGF